MKYVPPYGATDPNASYVDKDSPGAVRGSAVARTAIEAPLRELDALVTKTGQTATNTDLLQVAKAVRSQKLNLATVGGTANVLTATLDPAPASLAEVVGVPVRLTIAATSTGAATLNVNATGVKNIQIEPGKPTRAGDLVAGTIVTVIYDGVAYQLQPTDGSVRQTIRALRAGTTTVTYSSGSGNFVVPADVTALEIEIVGGGGGGGYAAAGGAGPGGNGGDLVFRTLAVTPGQVIAYAVGIGGSGGTAGVQAQPGGDTSFGAMLAKGGTASANVGAVAGSAVALAAGSTGGQVNPGQQAEAGFIVADPQQWGGHGGNSPAGGNGGNGARNGGTAGNAGTAPGGGGGGGSNAGTGGAGGPGRIKISYM